MLNFKIQTLFIQRYPMEITKKSKYWTDIVSSASHQEFGSSKATKV